MSRESFLPSTQTENKNEENREKKHLDIPMVDATMKECEKRIERKEAGVHLHSFLEEYFSEAIKNTEIYTSERLGASFPYAVVRLPELAKKLYEEMGSPKNMGELMVRDSQEDEYRSAEVTESVFPKGVLRQEFIFGTMFSVGSAHSFHWIEHGLDQMAKKLPEALRALSHGEEPENIEVYGMGNPAGEFGAISDDFLGKMGDKPFEYTGELYAEFLKNLSEKEKNKKSFFRLWGVSMGASMAGTTADALLKEGGASQSFEEAREKNIPYVSVNMQSPVGSSGPRKWQIPIGFVAEIAYQLSVGGSPYNREVGKKEGVFMETIKKELKEKGIEPHVSEEELREKNKVISKLLDELRNGVTVPEELKTNEVIGVFDPLMFSLENEWALEKREWEEAGKHSLGKSIMPSEDENHRKFVINQTHTPLVVRENYFKRLIKVGEVMEKMARKQV